MYHLLIAPLPRNETLQKRHASHFNTSLPERIFTFSASLFQDVKKATKVLACASNATTQQETLGNNVTLLW